MRTLLATVAGLFGLAASLSAQPATTFQELSLRLNVGDQVTVEDTAGLVVKGRVTRLTPGELVVTSIAGAERAFAAVAVRRVERRGDSLGNGMRRGAILGAVLGGALSSVFSGEFRAGDLFQGAAIFGASGLGLGLALDAANVGTTTVYSAPMDTQASRHGGGRLAFQASFRW